MTTWMKIALVLNVLGTIGVGVIPIVGRTAGAGGGVAFRSSGWRAGWLGGVVVGLAGRVDRLPSRYRARSSRALTSSRWSRPGRPSLRLSSSQEPATDDRLLFDAKDPARIFEGQNHLVVLSERVVKRGFLEKRTRVAHRPIG